MVTRLSLSHPDNLRVVVTIIGYRSQGESVIFRVVDGDTTKYCLVVDCYKLKGRNVTTEFLRDKYQVSHINMLCWSHPHIDHSRGLAELMTDFCDDKTEYILPAHFYNMPGVDLVTIRDKQEKDTVDEIFRVNQRTKLSATNVEVKAQNFNQLESFSLLSPGMEPIPVGIYALTPISSILGNSVKKGEHDLNPNDLSVSLLIDVAGYRLFLGADAIAKHIAEMDTSMLDGCKFVKIPHHGSSTSEELLRYLPSSIDISCSTVYHIKGDLPEKGMIDRYKERGQVYCTGDYVKKNRHSGVVEFEIALNRKEIEYSITCYNTAKEL